MQKSRLNDPYFRDLETLKNVLIFETLKNYWTKEEERREREESARAHTHTTTRAAAAATAAFFAQSDQKRYN